MAKSHAALAATLRAEDGPDAELEGFTAAAGAHFRRAHDASFALGQDFAARTVDGHHRHSTGMI